MQNWKRIIEKARNKLSLVELGRIPRKNSCSLCVLLMSAGKIIYFDKNESCHFRVTGQSKKDVKTFHREPVPQKAQCRD
jgi:hypothetical protein